MTLIVEPYRLHHLQLLIYQGPQAAQLRTLSHLPASCAKVTENLGPALTVREGERIILVGGMASVAKHYGILWAVLSADAGRHMLFLHRGVKRFLDMQHVRRLEATCEEGFGAGCKWLDLLGFEFEGRMRAYGDLGETHLRYARVLP